MIFEEIRLACANDFKNGLKECLEAFGPVTYNESGFPVRLFTRFARGTDTYVAAYGDQVVGTISVIAEEKLIHGGQPVFHIEDVSVLPRYQNQGVARRLVQYAITLAKSRGARKVILDCSEALVPFYAKLGFTEHGTQMRLDIVVAPS